MIIEKLKPYKWCTPFSFMCTFYLLTRKAVKETIYHTYSIHELDLSIFCH